MAATILDRLIGWVSPGAGLRRVIERRQLQRAYEGASSMDGWRPRRPGASANADHAADASMLRARSRALIQNVPYIAAGMDSRVAAIVGTGLTPSFRSKTGKKNAKLEKLWKRWVRVAGADQVRNLYALQALAVRTDDADGEVLIRKRWRRLNDGLPVPLQLQVLEVDWLDTSRTKGDGGNVVVNGIEYDALGNAVQYWLWDQHPGDSTLRAGVRTQSRPVPASEIIHVFAPRRPGQGRGFPRLASVIARVRDTQLYEDAELNRKNQEARLGVIYTGDATALAGADVNPGDAAKTGSLGDLPSGSILQLPAGGNITVVEPTAAPGHTDYVKHQIKIICAGGGFTYEAATGDMREVNFSSARVRRLDFQREIESLQWLHVIPDLCEPIAQAFLAAAELANEIPSAADIEVEWSTPKWDYVNPQQEIAADLAEISGGLSSISSKLRRRGEDPAAVFAEMEADMRELERRGLLPFLLAMQKASPMQATDPAADPAPAPQ